jgi:hypothetical protein
LVGLVAIRADDGPPPKSRAADLDRPGQRAGDGPAEPGRRPLKPPRDGDFDRPPPPDGEGPPRLGPMIPPKPPRDGDFDRPPPKPDEDGPPGLGIKIPPKPPRDGDADRPPPRWPHEDWESMQKNDPELYKLVKEDMDLDRQTRALAMQHRRAPKDQREKIKQQVLELVGKHFEVRQQHRSLELKRLEEELARLRDTLDRRAKARKELIEKRVSELLGRDDDVGF